MQVHWLVETFMESFGYRSSRHKITCLHTAGHQKRLAHIFYECYLSTNTSAYYACCYRCLGFFVVILRKPCFPTFMDSFQVIEWWTDDTRVPDNRNHYYQEYVKDVLIVWNAELTLSRLWLWVAPWKLVHGSKFKGSLCTCGCHFW